jgi:hypothetical protein
LRAVTAVTSVSDKDVMTMRETNDEGGIICCCRSAVDRFVGWAKARCTG